jgi:hypothetical protein
MQALRCKPLHNHFVLIKICVVVEGYIRRAEQSEKKGGAKKQDANRELGRSAIHLISIINRDLIQKENLWP